MFKEFKFKIKDEEHVIKKRMTAGSGVQRVIDSEVIRRVDPYTPFRDGVLKSRPIVQTKLGKGKIVQKTPYARRLYYNRDYNFSGSPKRGAFWFERMKADHKDDILKLAKRVVGAK